MLTFFIYFLTAVLVLDCLFLILLVLVQLPKKEAGMGQAFGGAATDALFGAGSGNVLTKATKWGAGIFFALAITLTLMGNFQNKSGGGSDLQKRMNAIKTADPVPAAPAAATEAPKPKVLELTVPGTNAGK
jgi:preprotein translocase subunit SecG